MPDERQNQEHHWATTRKHTEDIGELKEGLARVDAGMIGLGDQMRAGFHTMNQSLQTATQPKPPIQWWAIAAVAISIVVGFLSIFSMQTAAMQRENDLRFQNTQMQVATMERENRAWLEANTRRMDTDDERERSDAHDQGRHDAELANLKMRINRLEDRGTAMIDRINSFIRERLSAREIK